MGDECLVRFQKCHPTERHHDIKKRTYSIITLKITRIIKTISETLVLFLLSRHNDAL